MIPYMLYVSSKQKIELGVDFGKLLFFFEWIPYFPILLFYPFVVGTYSIIKYSIYGTST